ncbi:3-oxo-5-alpha-steroid 4-dehydrogenase-domain-containing protein [Irpex rosettiformis]|uniref:3-oxo-5-alpha-steroid 4-dehydrogenase-domain-containing protein n=1 Tax=Irpex rosettiformis TaxID=378272 RepID=A0ACB8U9H6_9APHY|nr:3-oxo-5-alpha-steroid 4-dehydrogenase-domain-containing protein [Irpex rosettiformis]
MVMRSEVIQNQNLYDFTKKWFAIAALFAAPVSFFYDAPFGRFAGKDQSGFPWVNGIKSWVVMESTSFIVCIFAYMTSPLSFKNYGHSPEISLSNPTAILSGLFLIHYTNRAFISPLRTPTRSKFHIIIPLTAITYTMVNGTLIGSYLSSPEAATFLTGAFSRPRFWFGIGLWILGFVGNIVHDEILFDLRRNPKPQAKAKSDGQDREDSDEEDDNNGKEKTPHYAIPYGYLYRFISYPNYFCEWLEWFGFALAAAPIPSLFHISSYQPPWVFLLTEVVTMFPRAYRGHQWYHRRFPDYPKERKAVIPFVV